jgi:hypothetical protein
MFTREEKLKAENEALNKASQMAMVIHKALLGVFQPLVGKQVLKVDGQLLSKYEKILPEMNYQSEGIRIWRVNSTYSLRWCVNCCVSRGEGCVYRDVGVYVGGLSAGILTKVENDLQLKTDYSYDEIFANIIKYKQLQQQADDAKSKIGPFDEKYF